jgi:hypothetical protein
MGSGHFAPVFYVGHESARMVHFVFDFEFVEGRELRVASEQSAEAVVQLPFLGVENSQFSFLAASGDPTLQSHGAISMATEEQIRSLSIRANAAPAAVLIASTL